jgi:putative transposase
MEISEIRRLRLLEEENGRLKKDRGAASAGHRCTEGGVVKKVVGPPAKRVAVRVAREEGKLSERRVCGLLGMNRGSWRCRRKKRNDDALRDRLRDLAGERPRFGYRRLHRMLRREKNNGIAKWVVNHKRVYRIYREEGLAMRRRKRKRFRAEARVPMALPTRANQMWTMDFTVTAWPTGGNFAR